MPYEQKSKIYRRYLNLPCCIIPVSELSECTFKSANLSQGIIRIHKLKKVHTLRPQIYPHLSSRFLRLKIHFPNL
jgi:hypothetical protein